MRKGRRQRVASLRLFERLNLDKCRFHTLALNIDQGLYASNGTGVPRMEHLPIALRNVLYVFSRCDKAWKSDAATFP